MVWYGMLCYAILCYGMESMVCYGISILCYEIYLLCYNMVYVVKDKHSATVIVSPDINYDHDFFIFVSTHSSNDRLLVILHDLRITFCVSSPADCYFCGVTFGNWSMNIYNKTNRDILLTRYFRLSLLRLLFNAMNIYSWNIYIILFCTVILYFNI